MKTKRQIKNFILKTLLPFKQNPDTCGYDNNTCQYLTNDGKKCALGKWLKDGPWQKSEQTASGTLDGYGDDILLKEARDMNFTNLQWDYIQNYHDVIAKGASYNWVVNRLEMSFDIKLPELKHEN